MSAMLLAEVVLLLATLAVSNSNTDLYAKYSNSQAQSLVNECGQDESSGINCVANGPQTQADGSAMATPIVSNAGGQGQQGPPGPPGPEGPPGQSTEPPTGIVSVIVEQICRPGGVPGGGDPQFCEKLIFPSPSEFTIQVLAGNPTSPFLGSSEGTNIITETGAYEVILLDVPEQPEAVEEASYRLTFSEDCIGSIEPGDIRICTITTTYEQGVPSGCCILDARPHLTIR